VARRCAIWCVKNAVILGRLRANRNSAGSGITIQSISCRITQRTPARLFQTQADWQLYAAKDSSTFHVACRGALFFSPILPCTTRITNRKPSRPIGLRLNLHESHPGIDATKVNGRVPSPEVQRFHGGLLILTISHHRNILRRGHLAFRRFCFLVNLGAYRYRLLAPFGISRSWQTTLCMTRQCGQARHAPLSSGLTNSFAASTQRPSRPQSTAASEIIREL
jgi:hypothetical protein